MKKIIVFFALCVVTFVYFNGGLRSRKSRVEDLLTWCHQNRMFNGVVLVADNNGLIYKGAFGKADRTLDIPLKTNCIFNIGSISKQFTAVCILKLVHDRVLALDDSIKEYFPELPDIMNDITIRHLLTHTSGLPDHYKEGMSINQVNNESVFNFIKTQTELKSKPGSEFIYSNSAYVLLATLVECLTGQSFPQFLSERIFIPLEMNDSYIGSSIQKDSACVAKAYNVINQLDSEVPDSYGAGGILSNLDDLYKWDMALHSGDVLPKYLMNEAYRNQLLTGNKNIGYGLGWHTELMDGNKTVYHAGKIAAYNCFYAHDVTQDQTIIILTNGGDNPSLKSVSIALDRVINYKFYKRPDRRLSDQFIKIKENSNASSAINTLNEIIRLRPKSMVIDESDINWIGYKYLNSGDINTALKLFNWNTMLFPTSQNVYDSYGEAFLIAGDTTKALENFKKVLHLNPINKSTKLHLKNLGYTVNDLFIEPKLDTIICKEYEGVYKIQKDFILNVSLERNELYVQANKQKRIAFYPIDNIRFYSKKIDAQISFTKDTKERVSGLILHQGGDKQARKIE